MMSTNLKDDLSNHLKNADEIWIAVALMKDSALRELQKEIKSSTKQNYLVGIDLPTEPKALRRLKEQQCESFVAGLCNTSREFHPKVYILRKDKELIAFVGSSNLTSGGFSNNIEMNLFTQDQDTCNSLLAWFKDLFDGSFPLSEENLNNYESEFLKFSDAENQARSRISRVKLTKPTKSNDPLDGIDFDDRYFNKEHHLAFREELRRDRSSHANKEREKVYRRFYQLHDQIINEFPKYNFNELKPHWVERFMVSHYYHQDGYTSDSLDSMWLSYGKPEEEIRRYQELFTKVPNEEKDTDRDLQSFINHARLQIRIELKEINIWLLFGKRNNGSIFDRDYFKKEMNKEEYKKEFFDLFKSLPEEFYISLSNEAWRYVREFPDAESLHEYCKTDKPLNHFIIGKSYNITDEEMSITNLPKTVLSEFKRLFPFYNTMRDKQFK